MELVAWTVAGLFVGAVVAWLAATKHAQSELTSKVGETERRFATAETKAAAAEATTTELRKQYDDMRQKTGDDLRRLRGIMRSLIMRDRLTTFLH